MRKLNKEDIKPGMCIRAKFKANPDKALWHNYYLPLMVIDEYKYFFRCIVLPHRNPNENYYFVSNAYPMTINKFDLIDGTVIVKEYWEMSGKEMV